MCKFVLLVGDDQGVLDGIIPRGKARDLRRRQSECINQDFDDLHGYIDVSELNCIAGCTRLAESFDRS